MKPQLDRNNYQKVQQIAGLGLILANFGTQFCNIFGVVLGFVSGFGFGTQNRIRQVRPEGIRTGSHLKASKFSHRLVTGLYCRNAAEKDLRRAWQSAWRPVRAIFSGASSKSKEGHARCGKARIRMVSHPGSSQRGENWREILARLAPPRPLKFLKSVERFLKTSLNCSDFPPCLFERVILSASPCNSH